MPRTPGAKNLKTLEKEKAAQAAKGATPAPSKPLPPPSVDPKKPAVVSSVTPEKSDLKGLAARVLEARAGNPEKARTPAAKKPDAKKPDAKKVTRDVEDVDPDVADSLAGVLADGEASLGSMFVPPEKQEKVEKLGSRILKYAWKYHFIQNGVNGFPSWAVLLIAHIGFFAALVLPNKEKIGEWWDGMTGKLKPKPTPHNVPTAEQKPDHTAKPATTDGPDGPPPVATLKPGPAETTI